MTLPAKATVRAATCVELQTIDRHEFMKVMLDHVETMEEIRSLINTRVDTAYNEEVYVDKHRVIMNLLVSSAKEFRAIKLLKDRLLGNKEDQLVDSRMHLEGNILLIIFLKIVVC